MKKYLLFGSALLSALFSSCYVDPYYGGSVGYGASSYGSGYSTSFFVSTGDARWAYDPYRYCYYDRYRSCYYDPYLSGYYPVGYCPVPVRGCPHPYNWSGRGVCPPPRQVRYSTLSRYDNRISNYQAANYHWARKVSSGGSSSWMNSSQRSQLHNRASQPQMAPQSQGSPGWMNGGLRPSSSSGLRTSTSPFSQPGFSSGSSSRSSRSQMNGSVPPSSIRQTPSIEPRPARGGMFDGLNRSRGDRSPSAAPIPTSTGMAPPSMPRSAPQSSHRSESRGESSGKTREPKGNSSFDSGGSGNSGGGLRRFQR